MLEKIDFNVASLSKQEYKSEHSALIDQLIVLQQKAHDRGIGLVVLFEGWNGAGKGSRISDLLYNLDARATSVYVTPRTDSCDVAAYRKKGAMAQGAYPMMQQFWDALDARGNISIYDGGWYDALVRRLLLESSKSERHDLLSGNFDAPHIQEMLRSVTWFEQQIANDGYIVVKFFLHISKQTQRKRLEALANSKQTRWRVSSNDLDRVKKYKKIYRLFDALIQHTDYDFAQWHLINGEDGRRANINIAQTLVEVLQHAIDAAPDPAEQKAQARAQANSAHAITQDLVSESEGSNAPLAQTASGVNQDGADGNAHVRQSDVKAAEDTLRAATAQALDQASHAPHASKFYIPQGYPSLENVDYHLHLQGDYHEELKREQKRFHDNQLHMYQRRLPLMVMFEGWDAAGKGGAIKRLAQALDARGYNIFPSPAPTKPELMHPFLWRYWTRLPKAGHVGIYDRSWYGRVLVERVEGFATPAEWSRAYDEINEFEYDMHTWGAVVVKFWVEVDRDVQLARFKERETNPYKQWKITAEDWRNREKYPQYFAAVQDMFRLTSTDFAPWNILESNDKHYARVKALRVVNEAIEKRLDS